MKKIFANIFSSAVYSSFLGSLIVFAGMLVSFINDGWGVIGEAIGGVILYYFITVIASCLIATFVAGPVYVVFTKYKIANYYTAFLLGLAVTLYCFGFSASLDNLYWNLTGGVTGLLFHHHYINKPSWVGRGYLTKPSN